MIYLSDINKELDETQTNKLDIVRKIVSVKKVELKILGV